MIKMVLCDVDGTLTNGGYLVSEDKQNSHHQGRAAILKIFNTRDFMGLQRLAYSGVLVVFISGAQDECIDRKVEMLEWKNMVRIHSDISNKLKFVQRIYSEDYSSEEMAFIGDDINDIELLHYVGIAACPADSCAEILEYISDREDGFVMTNKGGSGAVREFADMIWTFNKKDDIINEKENNDVSSSE